MQIHVARNSAQLGIFSSEEITSGLSSGRFLASDLAWRDGMPAWTPLGDWSEFRAFGAATGVSPWVQFGISCFVWFLLCCCCCLLPIIVLFKAIGLA